MRTLGVPAFALLAVVALATVSEPVADSNAPKQAPPRLLDLGSQRHPISTAVPEAQRYFDQGLILTFGFNHEAAVRSFAYAARLDPDCAMCFWGIALALGPNINAPMGPEAGKRANAAVQRAWLLAPKATPREQLYIASLSKRYSSEPREDRSVLDGAYADAMRDLYRANPSDLDAATLYAESLMDLYPWDYWTAEGEPRERTKEILRLLERVLERNPKHVGANHYYIHAVEEFFPERAVPAADRLHSLAPDSGHLVHMPSHIYWRVGRYDDAIEINQRAAAADEQFFSWCRPGAFYRAAYYPHNIHFLWAAATTEGRSEIALSAARKLATKTASKLEEFDFLEEFLAVPVLTLARFGRWDAVLGEPRPDPARRYLTGIWHYARGLAYLRTGKADAAQNELAALRQVGADPATAELILAGGVANAAELLAIADAHLAGELAAARGDADEAVVQLELAVARQDALSYMEPPPWYFPTRQALGALLLEAGRADQAEAVHRKDLEQYPSNGWSLFGLAQSLRAQGKDEEAELVERGFAEAWSRADVELVAARF